MKYEKVFLSITFTLGYLISIVLSLQGAVGALAIVMIIPAFSALVSTLIELKSFKALFKPFFYKISLKSLIFTILFPLIIICLCALLALFTKQGVLSENWNNILVKILKLILISIVFFVIGLFEEYGWRGYLLPRLIRNYGLKKANVIMGIIWACYHIPALFILNLQYGITTAIIYVLLQSLNIYVFNYAFTYLYTLSQNVVLPSIMHILWNNVNVAVLGDSYRSVSNGLIIGKIQIINGEYLFGLIFLGMFAFYAHKIFLKRSVKFLYQPLLTHEKA